MQTQDAAKQVTRQVLLPDSEGRKLRRKRLHCDNARSDVDRSSPLAKQGVVTVQMGVTYGHAHHALHRTRAEVAQLVRHQRFP